MKPELADQQVLEAYPFELLGRADGAAVGPLLQLLDGQGMLGGGFADFDQNPDSDPGSCFTQPFG